MHEFFCLFDRGDGSLLISRRVCSEEQLEVRTDRTIAASKTPVRDAVDQLALFPREGAIHISVIVPTYNGSETLPACLNALTTQDFPAGNYEVIVVDDGSTDNTASIVKGYEKKTPAVRYIHQPNQGPAAARNNGARHATGDIIMFTDDDCEPQRDWISEMHKPFVEVGGGIEAVKGAYRTRQTSVIARFAQTEFETRYRKMRNSRYVDFVDTYAAAFRRKTFLALNGFDTSFPLANNEDVEFSYRMAAQGCKMVFNPNAIVVHTHPDTLFGYLKVKFGRAYWRMAVYRKFPGKMKADSYTPQTLKLQILLIFLLICSLAYEFFLKKPFYISIGIGALFLLTALPFL
jgi:glycosyltransferase involved in cell wall biosynthesis